MRTDVDVSIQNDLSARKGTNARQMVYVTGRDRDTGAAESVGFWTGDDVVTATVKSGATGTNVVRDYQAGGSLLSISGIPLVCDLTIQTVRVTLSHINEAVLLAIRGYDPRFGLIDIHRPRLDIGTNLPIGVPNCHFHGIVNRIKINDPKVGDDGSIELSVVSYFRELGRSNAAKRSDETGKLRSGDRIYRYAGTAHQVEVQWGGDPE